MLKKCQANQGFTLLECLLALFVLSIVCVMMNDLVRLEKQMRRSNQLKSATQWHLFVIQLENSSHDWVFQSSTTDTLTFKDTLDNNQDNLLVIEGYQQQIKKRKRGGYEPLLFEVESFEVIEDSKGLTLLVEMTDGGKYESFFKQWRRSQE